MAKKFLENDKQFLASKNCSESTNPNYANKASAKDIADFLGWGSTKVSNSLKRLKAIDDGKLSKEAIEILPTELHDETVKVAKKFLENDRFFLESKKNNKSGDKTQASGKEIADFLGWARQFVQLVLIWLVTATLLVLYSLIIANTANTHSNR